MKERMEYQQLKKMGKVELLRLLEELERENEELRNTQAEMEKQSEAYKTQLVEIEQELERAKLAYTKPGSLADSMLQVNGVMQAAQKAADQYLENIQKMEAAQQIKADAIIRAAIQKADNIVLKAKKSTKQAEEVSIGILRSLQKEVDHILDDVRNLQKQEGSATPTEIVAETAKRATEIEKVPHLSDILGDAEGTEGKVYEKELVNSKEAKEEPKQTEKKETSSDSEVEDIIQDLANKIQNLGE